LVTQDAKKGYARHLIAAHYHAAFIEAQGVGAAVRFRDLYAALGQPSPRLVLSDLHPIACQGGLPYAILLIVHAA